jgi:hypothetical protein
MQLSVFEVKSLFIRPFKGIITVQSWANLPNPAKDAGPMAIADDSQRNYVLRMVPQAGSLSWFTEARPYKSSYGLDRV